MNIVNSIESYSKLDADYLHCIYRPNAVNPIFMKKLNTNYRTSLFLFLGSSVIKGADIRSAPLLPIYHKLISIYPKSKLWLKSEILTKFIPYKDFVKQYAMSEVYIDLYRLSPNEGYSYRIFEALWLNRKIITNRANIDKEIFYSKDRIFRIGIDNIDTLKAFLETDIRPLDHNILKYYNSLLCWKESDPYIK